MSSRLLNLAMASVGIVAVLTLAPAAVFAQPPAPPQGGGPGGPGGGKPPAGGGVPSFFGGPRHVPGGPVQHSGRWASRHAGLLERIE